MEGSKVRQILDELGVTQTSIARKLNTSSANLSANLQSANVKSGFLEQVAAALGRDMSIFYGEGCECRPQLYGMQQLNSNNTAGRDISIGASEQLAALTEQNARLIEQNAALTRVIENLTKR